MDCRRKEAPLRRLRVPAALAVAFVGSSAAITMWYGGCHAGTPDPVDGRQIQMAHDAGGPDGVVDDAAPVDASDAPRDDAPPDTPPV